MAPLPAEARRNLIEDLNEAGFTDPRNPTAADIASAAGIGPPVRRSASVGTSTYSRTT